MAPSKATRAMAVDPGLTALPPWCEVARLPALRLRDGPEENWQCGLASSLLLCSSAPAAPPSLLLGCSEAELEDLLCAYPPLLRRLRSLRGEVDAWAAERTEPRSVLLAALQAARRFSAPDSSGRGFCVLPGFLGRATPCLAGAGLGCHLVSGKQHVVHTVASGREKGEQPSRCFGALPNDELMLRHGVSVAGNLRETVRVEGMRAALRASGVLSVDELERCRQLDLSAQRGGGSADGEDGDGDDGDDGDGSDDDNALFLSCAAEHGPCWPGIPGPDVCDLATMVSVRAIVAQGDGEAQGDGDTGRWPLQPAASELRAWALLAALLRNELRMRFAPLPAGSGSDGGSSGGGDEDEQRGFCFVFRAEKRRVLERSLERLELCIEASRRALATTATTTDAAGAAAQAPPSLVLDADASGSRGGYDDDASTFTAHAAAMPPLTRRLIAENADPAVADPYTLLRELRLAEPAFRAADAGLRLSVDAAVRRYRGALAPASCSVLRRAVDDDRRRTRRRDTIDGGPDHQLNLSEIELEELVGATAVRSLLQMAAEAEATIPAAVPLADNDGGGGGGATAARPEFFVRRYSSGTRPWIPFHCDTVSVTLNVALNDDCEFCGGTLLALCGGEVRAIHRAEGEATVHRSALLHAVTRMQAGGSRYSLVIFVHVTG